MRSAAEWYEMTSDVSELGASCHRELDAGLLGFVVVKDTIFVEDEVKSVSMPSALPVLVDGSGLRIRDGRVNARREPVLDFERGGAAAAASGEDIAASAASSGHGLFRAAVEQRRWRWWRVERGGSCG